MKKSAFFFLVPLLISLLNCTFLQAQELPRTRLVTPVHVYTSEDEAELNVTIDNFYIHGKKINSTYNGMFAVMHTEGLMFK